MTSSRSILVFTDLDGTLIDHDTYSWKGASGAVKKLKGLGIPIILCTSKTRAEIEVYRKKIGLNAPFVSENGGGIFIPKGYFDFAFDYDKVVDDYKVIELGTHYDMIRGVLKDLKDFGMIIGFGDMTVNEVMKNTGLPKDEAKLAKEREYDEAFIFEGDESGLKNAIEQLGFNWTKGGRFWHIMGENDKGEAVRILKELFEEKLGKVRTVGLGDSLNDLPMLKGVDVPIIVQKPNNSYDPRVKVSGLRKAKKPGPEGWNEEILELLK
jgi:mannosyl-3-phosphoglycerate phosphatase